MARSSSDCEARSSRSCWCSISGLVGGETETRGIGVSSGVALFSVDSVSAPSGRVFAKAVGGRAETAKTTIPASKIRILIPPSEKRSTLKHEHLSQARRCEIVLDKKATCEVARRLVKTVGGERRVYAEGEASAWRKQIRRRRSRPGQRGDFRFSVRPCRLSRDRRNRRDSRRS